MFIFKPDRKYRKKERHYYPSRFPRNKKKLKLRLKKMYNDIPVAILPESDWQIGDNAYCWDNDAT